MPKDLLVGLDLGSSRIRFAVGQVSETPPRTGSYAAERGLALSIVGAVDAESQGVTKGVVTALEDAVASLSAALEATERQVGVPFDEAIVGIGGTHVSVVNAKGVVGVSRADGEIRAEDVDRVLEEAKSAVNPANHEILHVLSHGFIVDGQPGVKDPVGMHGIRLEASAHLVIGLAGNVRNMTKAVFRTGLDIAQLAFGPLASAEAVTTAREREVGVCVVNIGAATTSVVIYEEGSLVHAAVLPLGADHVTSDVAIGLRSSLPVAEAVKRDRGSALPESVAQHDEINLRDYGADTDEAVSVRLVAEMIDARVQELFEKVEQELRAADRSGLLPAGVVLTGGGAKLHGMVEVAKQTLRLPASLGAATHLSSSMPELAHDPAFSTAVGLVQFGFEELRRGEDHSSGGGRRAASRLLSSGNAMMGKAGGMMRKVFKSFIP